MQHGKVLFSTFLLFAFLGAFAAPASASCTIECEVPWWQFWRDCGSMTVSCSGSLTCSDGQCGEWDGRALCFGGVHGNWRATLICGPRVPPGGLADTPRREIDARWDLLRGETAGGSATVLASSDLTRIGFPVAADLAPGDLELAVRPACDRRGETSSPRLVGIDISNRAAARWPENAEGAHSLLRLEVDIDGAVLGTSVVYEDGSSAARWLARYVPEHVTIRFDVPPTRAVELVLFVRLADGRRIDHAAALIR